MQGKEHTPIANRVRLIQKVLLVSRCGFGVLVDRNNDCLDMPIAPPLPNGFATATSSRAVRKGERPGSSERGLNYHCRPPSTLLSKDDQAVFAFLLAREKTNRTSPVYKKGEGNRSWLVQDPDFLAAFLEAKARVRAMDFRFVEQTDQTLQALLEIYTAVVLRTKYNDFANH
jgi:hypothetical protein